MSNFVINQFDLVEIKTFDNAMWLYNAPPPGVTETGVWSVVRVAGIWLVLFRFGRLLRIPYIDVHRIASYSLDALFARIDGMLHGKQEIKQEPTSR